MAAPRGELTVGSGASKVLQTPSLPPQSNEKGLAVNEESHVVTNSERRTGVPLLKRLGIYALLLVIGFLLGLVPMWLSARRGAKELETTRAELQRSQMRSALSAAANDARRGDYELARKSMSDFFTALSTELDRGEASALDQAQQDAVRPLLTQRDEIITLLARSDPAAADRLSNLDAAYRKATGNAQLSSPQ